MKLTNVSTDKENLIEELSDNELELASGGDSNKICTKVQLMDICCQHGHLVKNVNVMASNYYCPQCRKSYTLMG